MINTSFSFTNISSNMSRNDNANKMTTEENFKSKATAKYDSVDGFTKKEKPNITAEDIDPNDPYSGLSEEDASILKDMRHEYTSNLQQEKYNKYEAEFTKATDERNAEVAKITAKCEKIATMIASGRNVSKGDQRYLGKNNPTSLSAALLKRSLTEMFKKKDDDEKPSKIVTKEDKNYDDLPFPEIENNSHELTDKELSRMPTAKSLPNYDQDYAHLFEDTTNNIRATPAISSSVATSVKLNITV